jgi:hypothetical protein
MSERNEVLLIVTKNHLQKNSSGAFGGHITKQNFSSAEGGALRKMECLLKWAFCFFL